MSNTLPPLPATTLGATARWQIRPWHISCTLAVLTLLVFMPTLYCDFVSYDDQAYILNNPHLREGWSPSGFWFALTGKVLELWHPVTLLSLQFDSGLFRSHAWGYHLHNNLLHALDVVLLFEFLRRATGDMWRSALVTALFAVHPLRVESVAWVVERKDVLCTLFLLLTLLAYLRYARRQSLALMLLMLLTFTLSMLAKPMYMTLPVFLLLLDFWPLRRWDRGAAFVNLPEPRTPRTVWPTRSLGFLLLEKIPFFLVFGLVAYPMIIGFATSELQMLKSSGAHPIEAAESQSTIITPEDASISACLSNSLVCYLRYAGKLVWFQNLSIIYPEVHWPLWAVIGSALVLAGATVIAALQVRRYPWILIGWLWFLLILSPVNNIHKFGPFSMADRYTYFSHIGLLIAIVWSIPNAWFRTSHDRKIAGFMIAAVLLLLSVNTVKQIGFWHNGTTLFVHAIEVSDPNFVAHLDLGITYGANHQHEQAEKEFRIAATMRPNSEDVHNNLACSLSYQGLAAQDRVDALEQSARGAPEERNTQIAAASELQRQKDSDSVHEFLEAIRINRKKTDNLGLIMEPYLRLNQPENALAFGQEALQRLRKVQAEHPGRTPARLPKLLTNIGMAYRDLGRYAEAEQAFQEALTLLPTFDYARENLGYLHTLQKHAANATQKSSPTSAP